MAKTYRELQVWQKAHELVLLTYQITNKFPSSEKYGVTPQMRRAAASVAANIVEGFKRKSVKESLNFYNMSDSSLEELKYYYLLSKELKYCPEEDYDRVSLLCNEVGKMLWAWCQSQRKNTKLI